MSNSLIRCKIKKREATQLGLQGSECPLELAIAGEGFLEEEEMERDSKVPWDLKWGSISPEGWVICETLETTGIKCCRTFVLGTERNRLMVKKTNECELPQPEVRAAASNGCNSRFWAHDGKWKPMEGVWTCDLKAGSVWDLNTWYVWIVVDRPWILMGFEVRSEIFRIQQKI